MWLKLISNHVFHRVALAVLAMNKSALKIHLNNHIVCVVNKFFADYVYCLLRLLEVSATWVIDGCTNAALLVCRGFSF